MSKLVLWVIIICGPRAGLICVGDSQTFKSKNICLKELKKHADLKIIGAKCAPVKKDYR